MVSIGYLQPLCVHVCMCVGDLCSLLFPSRVGRMRALEILTAKLTKVTLNIGSLSHLLSSWRKSAQLQKPSLPISKAIHQHDTAEKKKGIRKCFNIAYSRAYYYSK